jgi:hypothetical protein
MSDVDRLARFRKAASTPDVKPTGEKQPYQAFQEGKDNQRYLELRLKVSGACRVPAKRHDYPDAGGMALGTGCHAHLRPYDGGDH